MDVRQPRNGKAGCPNSSKRQHTVAHQVYGIPLTIGSTWVIYLALQYPRCYQKVHNLQLLATPSVNDHMLSWVLCLHAVTTVADPATISKSSSMAGLKAQ